MTDTGIGTRSTWRVLALGGLVMILVLGGLAACRGSTRQARKTSPSRDNLGGPTHDMVRATQESNQPTPQPTELVHQAGIPPIDAAALTETDIATFALG
jgi:hypothetical protein